MCGILLDLPVHVGQRRRRQVVGVEDGFEADHREEERRPHDDGVRHLQLLLALVPEDAVQQHACVTGMKCQAWGGKWT